MEQVAHITNRTTDAPLLIRRMSRLTKSFTSGTNLGGSPVSPVDCVLDVEPEVPVSSAAKNAVGTTMERTLGKKNKHIEVPLIQHATYPTMRRDELMLMSRGWSGNSKFSAP